MSSRVIRHIHASGTDQFICSLCGRGFKKGIESRAEYGVRLILICEYCAADLLDVYDNGVKRISRRVSRAKNRTVVIDSEGRAVIKRVSIVKRIKLFDNKEQYKYCKE